MSTDTEETQRRDRVRVRPPTDQELAGALLYCRRRFPLRGGLIMTGQWAEGLAADFREPCDGVVLETIRKVRVQLSEELWCRVAVEADRLRYSRGQEPRFVFELRACD